MTSEPPNTDVIEPAPVVLDARALGRFGSTHAQPYVARVARCLEGINLKGVERSIKLSPDGMWPNRFLVGAALDQVSPRRVQHIAGTLGMPRVYRARLDDALRTANVVLIGFEEGPAGCVYKLYLEYWERVRSRVNTGDLRPSMMFLGFKWLADDNRRNAVSEYWCLPKLPARGIIERIRAICGAPEGGGAADAARGVVEMTSGKPGPLVYLEVVERGNVRRSFDLNLYPAGLALADVDGVTARLCARWGSDKASLDRSVASTRCALGHISGGVDRDGREFFTLYYDTSPP